MTRSGLRGKAKKKAIRGYLKNASGNLTMIVGLTAVPMVLAAGVGIDFVRINQEETAFHAAVDSAMLAVVASDRASLTGLSDSQTTARIAELNSYAAKYIAENFHANDTDPPAVTTELAITDAKVTLIAHTSIPTSLMGFSGARETNFNVTSEVQKGARPVELVMVMDTTGSMGTTYEAQARTAGHNLMTKIYGGTATARPESPYIRVALVPFSAAVRINTSAYDYNSGWIDTTGAAAVSKLNFSTSGTSTPDTTWNNYLAWTKLSSQTWNGCVEARSATLGYNIDDTAPTGGDTLFTPYFAPDEASVSSQGFYNTYIGNSGTPNETTGLTTSVTGTNNNTNYLIRQNNEAKYVNKTITAEASSDYGPWFNCVKTPIVPLTYNRAHVEAGIDAMTASGSTVIPEGLAWGWRVLSPTEPFTKVEAGPSQPADTISTYNHPRWRKVMVLMTDGENDVLSNGSQVNSLNGGWYSSYGRITATTGNRFGTTSVSSANGKLDTAMLSLCTKIKAKGVEIYTVAFRVTNTTILSNLRTCATDTSHYSYAADGVALGTVFSHIGENVNNASIYISK
jgi:Flp pilus assembly protein TadG